jgi:hypothetical protein
MKSQKRIAAIRRALVSALDALGGKVTRKLSASESKEAVQPLVLFSRIPTGYS